MAHEALVDRYRSGFPRGYTAITREGEPGLDTGIDFGIQVQTDGRMLQEWDPKESAWVLLDGEAEVRLGDESMVVTRRSVFDEPPSVLHLGPETWVEFRPRSPRVEWAVARASCGQRFRPQLWRGDEVGLEIRGRGLAQGACVRHVRAVIDPANRPESGLVLGEVVTWPGRWSSYPPHRHPQPAVYHFRFTLPQGFGHAELDEEVVKVRPHDTLKVMEHRSHAQVAAPGYGMYALWVMRHLRDHPMVEMEIETEHSWVLDSRTQGWEPR